MAFKISRERKEKILNDWRASGSFSQAAQLNGVSESTVRKYALQSGKDGEGGKLKTGGRQVDITSFMKDKTELVCSIIDKTLIILNDEEKLAEATLSQLTSMLNAVTDTWSELGAGAGDRENNFFAAINGCGQEGFDDLPELFKAAEDDGAVVEDEKVS